MALETRESVFRLPATAVGRRMPFLRRPVEGALGLSTLQRLYLSLPNSDSPVEFIDQVFDLFQVTIETDRTDLDRIPVEGPVVVVANHPFGGIEGMALARLVHAIRPDVRVLANFLLGRIPELRDLFLLVDPFEGPGAAHRSLAGLRVAHRWLESAGALIVFPAGEVAHFDLRQRAVVDPPWMPTVSRLVRRSHSTVVPAHIEGRNRTLFQIAGLIHHSLRTALLPREFLASRGSTLRVRFGNPIPSSDLEVFEGDTDVVAYLRRRTEILGERPPLPRTAIQPRRTPSSAAAIHPAIDPDLLSAEINALPKHALLTSGGGQEVWLADAEQIPSLLTEIGRLRELTFREVGEGTGRALDLDHYDQTYQHLFVWHPKRREVVGAYRIGRTRELLAEGGLDRLYTSTLFRYNRKLFDSMGPALEMGRSFIRTEYQRSFAGLLLLWKGIGKLTIRHPECATLFGPVSISANYSSASQQLIVEFLKQNAYSHDWSRWVHPGTAFRGAPSRAIRNGVAGLRDLDDVSRFLAEIENDGKGAPVLCANTFASAVACSDSTSTRSSRTCSTYSSWWIYARPHRGPSPATWGGTAPPRFALSTDSTVNPSMGIP